MGFFRGLGKFFGSTIFTTFIVLAILMMDIVIFTSFDNVKAVAGGILKEQLFSKMSQDDLAALKTMMSFQCSQTSQINLPIAGGQTIAMNCDDVENMEASQLPDVITNSIISSFYYRKFDCSFVDCLKRGGVENLMILASNDGNQFYRSLQTYMWIGAAIGLAILLVSTETWIGRLKGVGWNLVFTGLPFLILGFIQSRFMPSLPTEIESSVKPIVDNLLSSIKNKFIIVLMVGIALVIAGYALGFYLSRKSGKKK